MSEKESPITLEEQISFVAWLSAHPFSELPFAGLARRDFCEAILKSLRVKAHPQPSIPEIGWLIETTASNGQVCYLSGIYRGMFYWSPDSTDAIRFSRQEDAERVMRDLAIRDALAIEHAWG